MSITLNLDSILNRGIVYSQCCDTCPSCDYFLVGKERFYQYIESYGGINFGCCLSYILPESNYNELISMCALYKSADTSNDGYFINSSWCNSGFSGCLETLKTKVGQTNYDMIISNGIVEQDRTFTKNGICLVLDLLEENGITDATEITENIINVLDKGLAVKCVSNKLLVFSSYEEMIKLNENLGYTLFSFVSDNSLNPNCN